MTTSTPAKTLLALLLDRSGSMQSLNPKETSGTINSMVEEQSGEEGLDLVVSRFDHKYDKVYNGNSKEFTLTQEHIEPRGMTALNDSIVRFIKDTTKQNKAKNTTNKYNKVICIILTDGEENQSKKYVGEIGREFIKNLILSKEKEGWVFYFVGANIDSITTGNQYGIDSKYCINFDHSEEGFRNVSRACSDSMSRYRRNEEFEFTEAERYMSVQIPMTNMTDNSENEPYNSNYVRQDSMDLYSNISNFTNSENSGNGGDSGNGGNSGDSGDSGDSGNNNQEPVRH